MKTNLRHEGAPLAVTALVMLNGIFLSANGLFMLVAPQVWYELVPGVTDTGFFNQHFIRDIGIIQLFLGVAFIVTCCGRSAASASGPPPRCGCPRTPCSTCGRSQSASARPRSYRAIFPPSPCPHSSASRSRSGKSAAPAPEERLLSEILNSRTRLKATGERP